MPQHPAAAAEIHHHWRRTRSDSSIQSVIQFARHARTNGDYIKVPIAWLLLRHA
jgi:hypothetical protein